MTPPRTAGLDTLRAAAIALVFMYHYMCFVSGRPTFGPASVIGWTGVDLFFVLSGYLIANQLFAGLAHGRTLSSGRFYARRALRTLPVFWLVLAAFRLWPDALGGRTPAPAWRFLTFTQNLGLQPGTAFSHAWSLCVEEQFYVALPLVLLAGAGLARAGVRVTRAHGWALLGVLAALGMAVRGALWFRIDPAHGGRPADFMTLVYYATPCRFDEFLPGVAVAMLKNLHPAAWARLTRHGSRWLALGAAGALAMWTLAYVEAARPVFGFFMTTFGYTLFAVSFALLVVAALSPCTWLHRRRVPGAERLALWSYAIYLSHRPLANVLANALAPLGVGGGALLAIVVVACVAAGAGLHGLVEAPFLRLRDRRAPSNFADASDAAARAGAMPVGS